jgi:hypothetical protein
VASSYLERILALRPWSNPGASHSACNVVRRILSPQKAPAGGCQCGAPRPCGHHPIFLRCTRPSATRPPHRSLPFRDLCRRFVLHGLRPSRFDSWAPFSCRFPSLSGVQKRGPWCGHAGRVRKRGGDCRAVR